MSSDPMDRFRDLMPEDQGRNYPGSNKPRSAVVRSERKRDEAQAWDRNPVLLRVNGVETELFDVGHLTKALGYRGSIIRKWEERGYMPKADLRYPGNGRFDKRRLYTRDQIESIARIAQEEGLLDGVPIGSTKFTERISPLFASGRAS